MCATPNKATVCVGFVDYRITPPLFAARESIGTISFAAVPLAFCRGPEFMPLCVVTSPSRTTSTF